MNACHDTAGAVHVLGWEPFFQTDSRYRRTTGGLKHCTYAVLVGDASQQSHVVQIAHCEQAGRTHQQLIMSLPRL